MATSATKERMKQLISGGSAGHQRVSGRGTHAEGQRFTESQRFTEDQRLRTGVSDMDRPAVKTVRTEAMRTGGTAASRGVSTGDRIRTEGRVIENEVIDRKIFTKTVDHQVLIEKRIYELEHRPVQQQFVVETRLVGARPVAGKPTEYVGTESREVEHRTRDLPHGDRKIVVHDVDVEEYEVRGRELEGRTTERVNLQSFGSERPAIVPLHKLEEIP